MSNKLGLKAVTARVTAGLLGGYAVAWGFAALVVALNVSAGRDYWEGIHLAYLLAFVVYLLAFLWAFASASLGRVWLGLGGGGGSMAALAWCLSRSMSFGA